MATVMAMKEVVPAATQSIGTVGGGGLRTCSCAFDNVGGCGGGSDDGDAPSPDHLALVSEHRIPVHITGHTCEMHRMTHDTTPAVP